MHNENTTPLYLRKNGTVPLIPCNCILVSKCVVQWFQKLSMMRLFIVTGFQTSASMPAHPRCVYHLLYGCDTLLLCMCEPSVIMVCHFLANICTCTMYTRNRSAKCSGKYRCKDIPIHSYVLMLVICAVHGHCKWNREEDGSFSSLSHAYVWSVSVNPVVLSFTCVVQRPVVDFYLAELPQVHETSILGMNLDGEFNPGGHTYGAKRGC